MGHDGRIQGGKLMDRHESAQESTRTLFMNIVILVVFVGLLGGFIFYFNKSEPDLKRIAMETLAEQFTKDVNNAHWQWQAEGRPSMIMLVQYEARLDNNQDLIEKDRRPITMSHLGWPRVEPSSAGCGELWQMVLNVRLEVEGFRVYPEFFDGVQQSGNALDARCRFRMSVGPQFEYKIYTGQVSRVTEG